MAQAKVYRFCQYRCSLVKDGSVSVPYDETDELCYSDDAVRVAQAIIPKGADREYFMVILRSAAGTIMGYNVVSMGTLNHTVVHPREVFKPAILASADGVILVHNHPSGVLIESDADDASTQRLVSAGILLGIPVLDHIVVANDGGYISYKQKGKL